MRTDNNAGFTLIEVMLTMSLVVLIAILSAPFYGQFIFSQEVAVTRDELVGSFSKARLYSMLGKGGTTWGVALDDGRIVLFRGTSFAGRDGGFDEIFPLHPSVTVSGMTEVVFASPTGQPDSQPTITISGDGAEEIWAMNSEGAVQEQ